MNSALTLMIWILLLFGDTYGDSVTQTEGRIILTEGASLTLNCSYQTSGSPFLSWYIQHPNEGLKLLVNEAKRKDQEKDNNGFWTKKIKEKSFFSLEKTSVQVKDSAVYYCVLRSTGNFRVSFGKGTRLFVETRESSQAQVKQVPLLMNIQEGENVSISCNYSSSLSMYLFWYRQDRGKSLELISALRANGALKIAGRFTTTLNTQTRHSSLLITATQTQDSATYFCTAPQ